MSDKTTKSTRRAFFLRGSAALGGAATAGAAALAAQKADPPDQQLESLRRELAGAHDRAAVRKLHLDFAALIEQQAYERAAQLFDEHAAVNLSGASADGKLGIVRLFEQHYRTQTVPALHGAYRQSASQQSDDVISISEDGLQAAATFHLDVLLCTPLQDDCTAAKMARLQGQFAARRWETGHLEGRYAKRAGQWQIVSLKYRQSGLA